MKKNRTMRIAAVMLVFALLTTCIISGSFAKYVTTGNAGTDMARVAKWGVTVTSTTSAFGKVYNNATNGNTAVTATYVASTHSVNALAANNVTKNDKTYENVVAPGTKGTILSNAISGTPEVDCKIVYKVTTLNLDGWTITVDSSPVEYCPIVFTIGGREVKQDAGESVSAFAARVKNEIEGLSVDKINAGTNLETDNAYDKSISWEWVFDVSSDADTKDTLLSATNSTIEFEMQVSVEQLD